MASIWGSVVSLFGGNNAQAAADGSSSADQQHAAAKPAAAEFDLSAPPPPSDNEKAMEPISTPVDFVVEPITNYTMKDYDVLKQEVNDFTNYEIMYDEGDSKMWVKAKGDGSTGFKRHKYCGVIPFNMETVYATLRDKKLRSEWDQRETKRIVLEVIKADAETKQPPMIVELVQKKGIPKLGFADRDMVTLNSIKREKVTTKDKQKRDRILSLCRSVTHSKAPPQHGVVRSKIIFMGMVLEYLDEHKTRYWSIAEVDPGGWVYSGLYNWATKAIPIEFENSVAKGCKTRLEKGLKNDDFVDYYAADAVPDV